MKEMLKSCIAILTLACVQLLSGATFELDCRSAAAIRFDAKLSVGDKLALALPENERFDIELVESSPSKIGGETFLGRVGGASGLLTATVVKGKRGLKINFTSPTSGFNYDVRTGARGTRVRKVNPADFIRTPSPSRVPVRKNPPVRKQMSVRREPNAGPVTVDVLVAYDNGAGDWLDSEDEDAETFAQSAVSRMNTALANTGLNSSFRFRLVGVCPVDARSTDLNAVLVAVTDGTGAWESVSSKREELGADIVTTLIDTGSAYGTTGLGWSLEDEANSGDYSWFSESAYNVCAVRSVAISHTMTHEVGHNMGAGHSDRQSVQPGPQLFDYSSGYYFTANGNNYHTVMAYDTDGHTAVSYVEVPYFSSPLHSYEGTAVGDSFHDNTRTLKNTFEQVAAFRAAKTEPVIDPDPEPESLTWYTTKAEAFAAAESAGRRILLVYGRDTCGNTTATRNYTCEDAEVKAKLLADYVLWYSNCDTQGSESSRYLVNFERTLPGVSVIDPASDTAIAGAGGYLNVAAMLRLLEEAESFVPPENDDFADAEELSGGSGSVTGTNVGATSETGEPLLSRYSSATTTVWWKWTASANGEVTFDTVGSGFDTVMGVYTGAGLSSLAEVDFDDDDGGDRASLCAVSCTAGTTYFVCVAGYGAASGEIALQWELEESGTSPTDDYNRTEKVGDYTWTFSIKNGEATIVHLGTDGYGSYWEDGQRAVDPAPQGELTIPETLGGYPVVGLGYQAIYDCDSMTAVTMPDAVKNVGRYAFYDCAVLHSVELGNAVTNIGESAFQYCFDLTSIELPASVVSIGNSAFWMCYALESLYIPANVACIGDSAFAACTELLRISVDETNLHYMSEDGVLYNASKDTIYFWPKQKMIEIPDGVRDISSYAFYANSASPGGSVTLPASVTNIGACAFEFCRLNAIVLNEGLVSIGRQALDGIQMRTIIIPSTVQRMDSDVFCNCHQLMAAYFAGNAPEYADPNVYRYASTAVVTFVRSGSTGWASAGSTELPEMWPMPNQWGNGEPHSIREWTTYPDVGWLVRFDLGEGAIRTGGGELEQMVRDGQSATAPELALNPGYEFVRWDKPFDCVSDSMTVVAIYKKDGKLLDGKNYTEKVGDYTWTFDVENGEATIVSRQVLSQYGYYETSCGVEPSPSGVLAVPATLGGCPVVGLGSSALYNCGMTSVTLPQTLVSIGNSAFQSCYNLTQVELPASVEAIGEGAFRYCSQLQGLTVDADNLYYSSEDGVLYDKTKETVFFWPMQKTIAIPDGVRDIRSYAFYNNYASQNQSVTLPPSVTNIGHWAFQSCNLNGVCLNEGLVSVGYGAFEYNSKLRSVVIPTTVERMGGSVFYGCDQLGSVFFAGDAPVLDGSYLYDGTPLDLTTFVRSGSTGWVALEGSELPEQWPKSDEWGNGSPRPIREWTTYPDIGWLVRFDIGEGAIRTDGGELEQMVREGQPATAPELALNPGYEFVGWDKPFDCVSNSMTVAAIYRKDGKLTDGRNYTEQVGDYTWTFDIENGEATIVSRQVPNQYGGYQILCGVEPSPSGALVVPAKLGGCPVVGLGSCALYNCSMTSVTLPQTLVSIGNSAFQSCYNLTQVDVPASVEAIGEVAFRYCSQLQGLTVDADNLYYSSDDGVLYDKTKEAIYFWPSQKTIAIPDGVRDIRSYAFYGNQDTYASSVSLPSSVTNIGQFAFLSCYYLAEVTLNEGLVSIGYGAFQYDSNLRSVVIPSTVEWIGEYVFNGCDLLGSVFFAGNAPEYVDNYVYGGVSSGLKTFVRPGSTGWKTAGSAELPELWPTSGSYQRSIETWTTYPDMPAMHTVTFVTGNRGWIRSGASVQTVLEGHGVVEPEVEPNSGFTFMGWSADTSVVTADMTVFAEYERENDDGSVSRVVGQNGYQWEFVVRDGKAVIGCANADGSWGWGYPVVPDPVGELVIPSKLRGYPVTGVEQHAFAGSAVTAVTIPASVTWIGDSAFRSCWQLQTVVFEGDETKIDIASDAFKYTPYEASLPFELIIEEDGEDRIVTGYRGLVPDELVIPEGVTGIGENVFSWAIECTEEGEPTTTVQFPSTLRWIGEEAFSGCYGLADLVLPEGLESIGVYAFAECGGMFEYEVGEDEWEVRPVGITSVTIPSTVKEIGEEAFFFCQALETVVFAGNEADIDIGRRAFTCTPFERDRDFEVIVRDNVVVGMHGIAPEEVELPDGITEIAPYAFCYDDHCTPGLRRVILPASVTNIGEYAFAYSGLRHVFIRGEGEVLYEYLMERMGLSVGESAFEETGYRDGWELPYFVIDEDGCLGIDWLEGYDDVGGCVTNGVMRVPEGVRAIGEEFFEGPGYDGWGEGWNLRYPSPMDELTALYLPASLERIGEYAFAYCRNLTKVVYAGNEAAVILERCAFVGTPYAEGLPFRLLTDGTTVMGFIGSPMPEVLEIPNGVTKIAEHAFERWLYDGDAVLPLRKVIIPASVTNIGSCAFYECRNLAEVAFRGDVSQIAFGISAFSGTPYGDAIRQPFLRISGTILEGVEWQDRYDGARGCVTNGIVKVPQDVTEIGRSALRGLGWGDVSGFRRVELPTSVRRVDEYAFSDCRKLEEVTFAATNGVFDSTAFCWEQYDKAKGGWTYTPSETLKSVRLVSPDATLAGWKLVARLGADKSKEKTFAADDLGAFAVFGGYDVVPLVGEGSSEEEEDTEEPVDVTTYTVTFDKNGGEGTMEPQLFTNGVAQALATNRFTFADKLFAGWATNAATEAVYTDGEAVRDLAAAGGTFALFATWKDDPNGNKNVPLADPKLRGDDLKAVETPVQALTYSGYVTNREEIVGLVTVKVATKGAVTATVQLSEGTKLAKTSYKGNLGKGGKAELVCSKNGGEMSALVCEGLVSGTIEVGKEKLGFTARSGAKDVLADLDGFSGKVWTVALKTAPAKDLPELMNGYSVLSVTGGKKGKMKVSGVLADGTKVSVTAQGMAFDDSVVVPVVYRKKMTAFSLKLLLKENGGVQVGNVSVWTSGSEEAVWEKAIASKPDNVKAGAKFALGMDVKDIIETFGAVDAAKGKKSILPNGVPLKAVDAASGKWTLPKAGKVALVKGSADQLDESKYTAKGESDPNPAALKLTFKQKTGLFNGSFQFYQLNGGKLKKLKATVNGAVVGGVGYGSGVVKNVGALPVTVGK